MDFWERVEEEVERQSTTFRWIAEKVVHKNETTVSSWRANNTQPRAAEAVKIAMALHTTVEYLVDGEEGQEYVRDLVRREGLWRQGGHNNLKAYRIAQNERLGMPRQTVSRRRLAGEGYLDNRKALGKFPLKGHVEKLRLLNEAVDKFGKREAVTKFKSSTLKEFIRWVRPSQLVAELYRVKAIVDDQGILIEGKPKVYWSNELDELERKWISGLMERAYNARNGGNLAHVVEVYDEGEARAVDNFLKKLRSKK